MNGFVRVLLSLAVAAVLLSGVLALQPALFAAVGLDFWELPELQRQIAEATRRREELEQEDETVVRNLQTKFEVIHDLIGERMSFREAVARFRALDESDPRRVRLTLNSYPGGTLHEAVCRQVFAWAVAETERLSPDRRDEVLWRLAAQQREVMSAAD